MKIRFKKLTPTAIVPTKATDGSAAYDLYVESDTLVLQGRSLIPTAIAIELPDGYVADVRPRSGYSLKGFVGNDSARLNCDVLLGTIDSDYRGGIGIIVKNNDIPFKVKAGQRIAQLLIHKCEEVEFEEVTELSQSKRNEGGFSSTGN